ncbi:MAG: GNAT family N-acetyltransferase [Pyrinomonadaceae bacterium]
MEGFVCEGERVFLRHPVLADVDEFVSKAMQSISFHRDLVSPPMDREAFAGFVEGSNTDSERRLLVIEKDGNQIAGVLSISQIFLKGFCSAYLGYYAFEGFQGRGLMSQGLEGALEYGFENVGLHRIEANIQPGNASSIELVKRHGFSKEGFSRKYLKIGGEWRDHERWALIVDDWGGKAISD